ncbi:hypothetical protein AB0283_22735 [Micromonospora vinacea]|uniref:hypothetical protein n=1 Tax=Micromonospora vinacea TaxID=709878 RepID=UPI00344BF3DA
MSSPAEPPSSYRAVRPDPKAPATNVANVSDRGGVATSDRHGDAQRSLWSFNGVMPRCTA